MPHFQTIVLRIEIAEIYYLLREHFGEQNWWPGDTLDEIAIGAILTQNTNWKNVEKAIKNLKVNNCLSLEKMLGMENNDIEEMIKPAGYYSRKRSYLKGLASLINTYSGGLADLLSSNRELTGVRNELLSVKGIGNETADSILLYAGSFLSFVIDAYTFRIFSRLGIYHNRKNYMGLQRIIVKNIPSDLSLYRDFHAQLVELGKNYCKKRSPLCGPCPLVKYCTRERL